MPDISIGRLRGGFCVYWDEDGKRRRYQLKAQSRKEAEAEGIDVFRRHQQAGGDSIPTVSRCFDEYQERLGSRPSGKTVGYVRKSICDVFGHYRPNQITHELCADYERRRLGSGKSVGTVHTELGHLRSALRYAEKIGMIDKAPHIWRPAKPAPKERYLDHAEIRRLIEHASTPHIRLAIILLLGTAGRVGAIIDLEWDRVDFERGTINLRLADGTGRKGRAIVPMNGMTRAALSAAAPAALTDFVVEYAGKPVKSIRKGFTTARDAAGLGSDVHIHTLRHSAAVHMISAGRSIEEVSNFLGHSNIAITHKVYAKFMPDRLRDAAEVLDFAKIRRA